MDKKFKITITNTLKEFRGGVPIVAQQAKNQMLSLRMWVQSLASLSRLRIWHCCKLQHRLQMQLQFSPWPGNFHILQIWLQKKKKKTGEEMEDFSREIAILELRNKYSEMKNSSNGINGRPDTEE